MSGDELKDAPIKPTARRSVSEFQPLIDELYREEVLDARKMSLEEKFLAGEELFEYACSITLGGIRSQNPGYDDEACRKELKRRLELQERMERAEMNDGK